MNKCLKYLIFCKYCLLSDVLFENKFICVCANVSESFYSIFHRNSLQQFNQQYTYLLWLLSWFLDSHLSISTTWQMNYIFYHKRCKFTESEKSDWMTIFIKRVIDLLSKLLIFHLLIRHILLIYSMFIKMSHSFSIHNYMFIFNFIRI